MKKLPIGISSFEKIMTENYAYIDKTKHIYNLVNTGGGRYFLSRPRRFGKSLLVDTIKQAFEGNKKLFKGLYLEKNWDWQTKYPVIHLNFGVSSSYHSKERFFTEIHSMLDQHAEEYSVLLKQTDYGVKFGELMRLLHKKFPQGVVVLVDEYDKPILDNLTNSELAIQMREILRGLYTYIKQNDSYIKFTLLTGVSKFSKVSLFSDLNNLNDITLSASYADICGYTQKELEASFKAHLDKGQVDYPLLKRWYNGYNFTGTEAQKVYNPFDILLFIDNSYRYYSYWFETATPSFLIKLVEKNHYFIPNLEELVVGEDVLKTFDVDNMPIATLLFQTGYLTIRNTTTIGTQYAYVLTYPNLEVKASLNGAFSSIATGATIKNQHFYQLSQSLFKEDFEGLKEIFSRHFAAIPNDWYRNNNIDQYEGFYASIVYSFFAALGYDLIAEDVTNHGKIDLTIIMPDKVLIIEFKLSKYGDAKQALAQIKMRRYPEKYISRQLPIYLIGMSFDANARNLVDFLVEKV
ncbi:ATP-binding protein [Facilibium subflavum]|uniref:ATP-binding protein n=1 Tax=Facilibium subflavum TaxID=2219058 RepID=UPI000E64DC0E|nr:ATP-binding protein [Facilibium subflavum]